MLPMPYWFPKACSLSVSTLANRTLGSKIAAAWTNAGAIILQGPTPRRPKIDQDRNVVIGNMVMESSSRQLQRLPIEDPLMTFATVRMLGKPQGRHTVNCLTVWANEVQRITH